MASTPPSFLAFFLSVRHVENTCSLYYFFHRQLLFNTLDFIPVIAGLAMPKRRAESEKNST
jgi:hypothetical protein